MKLSSEGTIALIVTGLVSWLIVVILNAIGVLKLLGCPEVRRILPPDFLCCQNAHGITDVHSNVLRRCPEPQFDQVVHFSPRSRSISSAWSLSYT